MEWIDKNCGKTHKKLLHKVYWLLQKIRREKEEGDVDILSRFHAMIRKCKKVRLGLPDSFKPALMEEAANLSKMECNNIATIDMGSDEKNLTDKHTKE